MNVLDNLLLLSITVESGGRFTDMTRNVTINGGSSVSTNALLHDAIIQVLTS